MRRVVHIGPRIRVWRGPTAGFVEMPEQRALPPPWCGVCHRAVDRITEASLGHAIQLTAYCHGRIEVVEIPLAQVRHAESVELGTAFALQGKDVAEQLSRKIFETLMGGPLPRSWEQGLTDDWREDINRRRRDLGVEPIAFKRGRR